MTVVRVRCPPRASLAEFEASIRAWVAHQCILLADFKIVSEANAVGLFDAEFDNPRDAKLFTRRSAGQPILSHTSPARSAPSISGQAESAKGNGALEPEYIKHRCRSRHLRSRKT